MTRWFTLPALLTLLASIGGLPALGLAQDDGAPQDGGVPQGGSPPPPVEPPPRPRGVRIHEREAFPGYTLIAPLRSKIVHLVDLDGREVHRWQTGFVPGSEYLLPNGNLLRCSKQPGVPRFKAGGQCGRLQEIAWDGSVVWDWQYATDQHLQHHDLTRTPAGTLLFIAWEHFSKSDAIAAGRHPAHVGDDGLWADTVIEIEPVQPNDAKILWEWHVWDHLIQDLDPAAANYGDVAAHPELFDINADLRRELPTDQEVADLKALGYISATPSAGELHADWFHTNSIAYDAAQDQILLSTPHLCELWILDHSTTSSDAKGHAGGRSGTGGDLLWRWGNPKNYGAGSNRDQKLFYQHDAKWIADGLPGAGHVLLYNNGAGRPDGSYSSVLELALPRGADGRYALTPFLAAGPAAPLWSYSGTAPGDLFSAYISGAQRLPNGNTLICEGQDGRVLEVTAAGQIVWEYLHPFGELDPGDGQPKTPHALFRATRIAVDHPGLAGKKLEPRE